MKIVTAIDMGYIPGLIALYNSYLVNKIPYDFVCLVHDIETENKVKTLGIPYKYIDWNIDFPITKEWPNSSTAMYSRLLIPSIFEDSITMWIDADAIILKNFTTPQLNNFPCASVVTSTKTIKEQIKGRIDINIGNLPAIQAGVLFFNKKEWLQQDILNKCINLMSLKDLDFIFVVQSILSLALRGNFEILPYKWNTFAGRGIVSEDTIIAHFVGQSCIPWKNKKVSNIDRWLNYYNNGKIV